jgi:ectoine hydroxylase-related dioxygenase (phytanoyl-CoA dioxygenase family)
MKQSSYGNIRQTVADDEVAQCVEEIGMRGFTIIKDLLPAEELAVWREKIDRIYERQEKEFGREALAAIQEIDICRAPLLYDFEFIKLATHQHFLPIIRAFLGDWFVLNLQNAIINRPNKGHHQSSWHRDLPYQNCVISRPLAINVLLAIDEFSEETGGTLVLPFTHKSEMLPSESYINANRQAAAASAGSAIVFDSMLFHRAGANTSSVIRRAVNQLYTSPIIKQQYDFPRALGAQPRLEPAIARLLGYDSQVPIDDQAWRRLRRERRGKPN